MTARLSFIIIFLSVIFSSVSALEFSASIAPSPSFVTSDALSGPQCRGFEIFSSLEINFIRLISLNFDYNYAYLNYTQDYDWFVDLNTQDVFLELRFYPVYFLPVLNGFFICAGSSVSFMTMNTDAIATTGTALSVSARGGYKWVVFGDKGIFIQPSFIVNYYLAGQEKFSSLIDVYYYGLKIELGWVF